MIRVQNTLSCLMDPRVSCIDGHIYIYYGKLPVPNAIYSEMNTYNDFDVDDEGEHESWTC